MLKLTKERFYNYKMKSLRADFWKHFGHSYAIFSMYCDYNDWRKILDEICKEITAPEIKRTINFLDIGAGIGKNTNEIIEIMISRYRTNVLADAVEPSPLARSYIKNIVIEKRFGGFLNKTYSDVTKIQKKKYDAIILMHSSYYIDDFFKKLTKLYNESLNQGGKILILSLPSSSIFFLKEDSLQLPYTSDKIISWLNDNEIDFSIKKLKSRFSSNIKFQKVYNPVKHFYKFFTRKEISIEKFILLYKKHIDNKTVNFNDELIIIKKS